MPDHSLSSCHRARCLVILIAFLLPVVALAADPPLPDGTAAATKALATFRVPAGMKVELFAAEPQLASPVAICLDERGRVFVAEEYRFNRGTEENRTRPFLLDDDLQIKTVDDRLAMFRKFADKFDGGMDWFSKWSDQVRLVEDHDGDGKADQRETLLHGFGVNAAFLGHDLHGLCWGPDGRLYFSIGDRGYHVKTKEGTVLSNPRRGAVFRCNPDGTQLEVVHIGLRNPQELAFDQFGNLFAADNNCDKGDHSRLVYVVDGGDSGWNMAYQTIPDPYLTGPWHAEKMWHLDEPILPSPPGRGAGGEGTSLPAAASNESSDKNRSKLPHPNPLPEGEGTAKYQIDPQRPAWVLPPVGKLGAGPSGFTYYAGIGLPDRYREHFFMCNYTGNGGIEAFAVKPRGASFEIDDMHDFFKPISATDCEFGYDGRMYVSDFVGLDWSGASKGGRIYTLFDPAKRDDPGVKQVAQFFREGFKQRGNDELAALLHHPDMRVRQRAQFALADRGDKAVAVLATLAKPSSHQLSRLHAVWGLWQLQRAGVAVLDHLRPLLGDADAEIRAQVAKVCGEVGDAAAATQIIKLLGDASPRVRFHAAIALGKRKHAGAVGPLVELLRENKDLDKYVRHACVFALAEIGQRDAVLAKANDPDAAVRLGVLLVLRRWKDVEVTRFLNDADIALVTEAARSINDLHLDAATPALAALLPRIANTVGPVPDALVRRVIHANFRLGQTNHAVGVVALATSSHLTPVVRGEALAALESWSAPSFRDRVTGYWRPLEPRDAAPVKQAVAENVSTLLTRSSGDMQASVVRLVQKLDIKTDDATFVAWVRDLERPVETRTAALRLLASRKSPDLRDLLNACLTDNRPQVRAEAEAVLAEVDPERGLEVLESVLRTNTSSLDERQRAFATLASLKTAAADAILRAWAERLAQPNGVPDELFLDVLDAATGRATPELKAITDRQQAAAQQADLMTRFRPALVGGDSDRGRTLFFNHAIAQCVRCHAVRGTGGTAGPELTQVGGKNPREHLLQSLIDPNAKIATGFAPVVLVLTNGKTLAGTLKSEDAQKVVVQTPDGTLVTIPIAEIDERNTGVSSMPPVRNVLQPRELRDLVEFLATLK